MTAETLAAWLLTIMLSAVPPGKSRWPKDAVETAEQGKARYQLIARALAEVVSDPKEKPLYGGRHARARTAALMLAMSMHESHWRRDVDLGLGRHAGKRAYNCMMQIAVPKKKTPEGWTADDLVKSRHKCFRRALHMLQRSRNYCGSRDHAFVKQYGSGHCNRGGNAVRKRVRTMDRWLGRFPPPSASRQRRDPAREPVRARPPKPPPR